MLQGGNQGFDEAFNVHTLRKSIEFGDSVNESCDVVVKLVYLILVQVLVDLVYLSVYRGDVGHLVFDKVF